MATFMVTYTRGSMTKELVFRGESFLEEFENGEYGFQTHKNTLRKQFLSRYREEEDFEVALDLLENIEYSDEEDIALLMEELDRLE